MSAGTLVSMRENDWTRVLGWPGYKVYRAEIDEPAKRLKLWVRRKRGNKHLVCSGCGQLVSTIAESYEREVRDLPWSEYLTTVVVELYRLRCPDCGVKAEKVPLLPSKAPFSRRFETLGSVKSENFGSGFRKFRAVGCSHHNITSWLQVEQSSEEIRPDGRRARLFR